VTNWPLTLPDDLEWDFDGENPGKSDEGSNRADVIPDQSENRVFPTSVSPGFSLMLVPAVVPESGFQSMWPLCVVGPSWDKERQGVLFPVPKTRFSAMMRGDGAHDSDLGVDCHRLGTVTNRR
jgi:hypothetical protein